MPAVTEQVKSEVRENVFSFFSKECGKDASQITDDTNIIDDLDGDSLMFLELLEMMKKKYNLNVQLQDVGKFLLKNKADTIGKVINSTLTVIEHEGNIKNL